MEKVNSEVNEWKNSNVQIFWGEIAPCDHLVQIYENDKIFIGTLEGFVGSGFLSGDNVVIIATAIHLKELNRRLEKQGFDINDLMASGQYIPLNANEELSRFMVNNWTDEKLFNEFVTNLIIRAKKNNRKVRVFGELVAVLWEQGNCGATVQLENLWHQLVHTNSFTLFCAYPKVGFTQNANDSITTICKTHSTVINGQARPDTEIYYKAV